MRAEAEERLRLAAQTREAERAAQAATQELARVREQLAAAQLAAARADARAMAGTLRTLGFEVQQHLDLGERAMNSGALLKEPVGFSHLHRASASPDDRANSIAAPNA